jgi:hypothetical protein
MKLQSSEIEIVFDEYPRLKVFFEAVNNAIIKFKLGMSNGERLTGGARLAHGFNCLTELRREFLDAEKALALGKPEEKDFEEELLAHWNQRLPREMSLGEERAIAVSIAYRNGIRPSFVGAKDTPMDAALQVAAYLEGLSLESGPETVRKSIQRFKKSIAGEEMFRLNRKTLKLEVHKAEDVLLEGLPNGPGRPRKADKQSCL